MTTATAQNHLQVTCKSPHVSLPKKISPQQSEFHAASHVAEKALEEIVTLN